MPSDDAISVDDHISKAHDVQPGSMRVPVGMGPVLTNAMALGTHQITLVVDDGHQGTSTCVETVTVITGCEAVEELVMLLEQQSIERKNKRPFIATLKASCASFDRGNCTSGVNQLHAFQNKVRAQIAKENPAEAAAFIASAQRIIDAVNCASE